MYRELWEAGAGEEAEGGEERARGVGGGVTRGQEEPACQGQATVKVMIRPGLEVQGFGTGVEAHGQGEFGPGGTTEIHRRYKAGPHPAASCMSSLGHT